MRIHRFSFVAAVAAALLAAGCASQKEPATQAIAAAETALGAIKEEAAKYAPEQLATVEQRLGELKASLQKGDYKSILASAPALTADVASLKSAAEAKKDEVMQALAAAQAEWPALAADLPKMVGAIQSRVDMLSKSRALPKGLDTASVESAKAGLGDMKAQWDEASAAFMAGDATVAVEKAKAIQAKGAEVMAALGMKAAGG
jgi:DNA repair exonuclease SbcCD ATPase subunit